MQSNRAVAKLVAVVLIKRWPLISRLLPSHGAIGTIPNPRVTAAGSRGTPRNSSNNPASTWAATPVAALSFCFNFGASTMVSPFILPTHQTRVWVVSAAHGIDRCCWYRIHHRTQRLALCTKNSHIVPTYPQHMCTCAKNAVFALCSKLCYVQIV